MTLPSPAIRIHTFLSISLLAALASTAAGQNKASNPAPLTIGTTVPGPGKSAMVIFQDKNDNYWFGSDGQGVFRNDGKNTLQFTTKDGLSNDHVRGIQGDKAGNVFITTLEGISKFDGQKFTTLTVTESKDPDQGWKLDPDDLWFQGLYGIKGHNGPYRYDGKTLYKLKLPKSFMEDEFHAKHPKMPFTPYDVYCIYRDKRGHVWFGTGALGLCRYDGKSWSWMYEEHLTTTKRGGAWCIRSIFEDKDGAFWICNNQYRYLVDHQDVTERAKGLVAYKRAKGIDAKSADGDWLYFFNFLEDKGDLWMVTYGEGVWRYDGKSMTQHLIKEGNEIVTSYSIYKDNHGNLWVGTHAGGAYKFNGKTFEKFRP